MRCIEHSFSDLLRRPKEVTDDTEEGDVLLRRRDEPDLWLCRADREAQRTDTFSAIGRALRKLASDNPAALADALADAFPWLEFLPANDRQLFTDEFSRFVTASTAIDNYEALSQLIREWRATAEIHSDPKLGRRLRRPIQAGGDVVAPPSV